MPWILAGGGVVVVAVAVVLVIVLTGGSDTSSPEGVAEAAVSAANDDDIDAIVELTCEGDKEDVEKQTDLGAMDPAFKDVKASYELGEVKKDGEDKATAEVTMSLSNVPEEYEEMMPDSVPMTLNLRKDGDSWCVGGLVPSGGLGG
jgi:hypothetical protein